MTIGKFHLGINQAELVEQTWRHGGGRGRTPEDASPEKQRGAETTTIHKETRGSVAPGEIGERVKSGRGAVTRGWYNPPSSRVIPRQSSLYYPEQPHFSSCWSCVTVRFPALEFHPGLLPRSVWLTDFAKVAKRSEDRGRQVDVCVEKTLVEVNILNFMKGEGACRVRNVIRPRRPISNLHYNTQH